MQPLAASSGSSSVGARLTYTSPDGEEGFPGRLNVAVTYTLSDDGAFTIRYDAATDQATVLTLSNQQHDGVPLRRSAVAGRQTTGGRHSLADPALCQGAARQMCRVRDREGGRAHPLPASPSPCTHPAAA